MWGSAVQSLFGLGEGSKILFWSLSVTDKVLVNISWKFQGLRFLVNFFGMTSLKRVVEGIVYPRVDSILDTSYTGLQRREDTQNFMASV